MMAKWPWRSKSMTPIFNTSRKNPKMHNWCKFGDSSSIHYKLSLRQATFLRILSQNGRPWRSKSMTSISIPAESIPGCMFGANLVILAQICDELSYRQAEFPRILGQNGKTNLKVKVNDLHFQYQSRVSQDECLVQIWWFQLKSVASYCVDKPNFLEFWFKMALMNLKVKVNDLHFQFQSRVSQDACLMQFWWFQLKSVKNYLADKVKFTDGRTNR